MLTAGGFPQASSLPAFLCTDSVMKTFPQKPQASSLKVLED